MTDVVIAWNEIYLDAIRKNPFAPGPIARAGAMLHAAIYDAVNSIEKTHKPYLLSLPTPVKTSAEAAVVYAAHRVLSAIYTAASLQSLFDQKLQDSLDQIKVSATAEEITNGQILGQAIANAILAIRTDDGSDNNTPYNPGANPGDWRLTDPDIFNKAATPYWGLVKPFTMQTGDQFRPPRPAGYATKTELLHSPEYAAQVNEVKRLGSKDAIERTSEQTDIAFFWANDVDGTSKPPGQLFRITQIVSEQRGLSLAENARLFALVALALGDAGIVAWDAKYDTDLDLWRPVSAIRLANTDGNPATQQDTTWTPLSVMGPASDPASKHFTPPFPAYISGHATFGATHAGIMRNFFGTDNVTFEVETEDPNAATDGVGMKQKRPFNSFSAAALENGRSRVYLGVHYQWDADHGYISGTKLADYVYTNFLQPV
jgi:membrane-associated phospholipid phosphatase